MTNNPSNEDAVAQPLLTPDAVLQEARELRRYWLKENKPYSAGVVADCIATIENLRSRAAPQASATQSVSPAGEGVREALEKIADERTQWEWHKNATATEALAEVAVQMRQLAKAALASNPLAGKGIQSTTEQASSGLRSPTSGED